MNKNNMIIGVIFGGRSAEHEISILSAKNVVKALESSGFLTALIGIDKDGKWYHILDRDFLENVNDVKSAKLPEKKEQILPLAFPDKTQFIEMSTGRPFDKLDVLFPILHGTFGEDGTVQGLFSLMDVPYVGSGVLGSSVGMDKDVMKRLLQQASIPIPQFLVFNFDEKEKIQYEAVKRYLGDTVFIKPANLGSSVGISRASNEDSFYRGVLNAFEYDTKIVIEEAIVGREIECSVLGNENPAASFPGEIKTGDGFYSYDAKYVEEDGAQLIIPAKLTEDEINTINQTSIKTFKTLCLEGLARVDGFLVEDGTFLVNEANTIPGFTMISMYPKLWEASGISQPELVRMLVEYAVENYERKKKLKRTV